MFKIKHTILLSNPGIGSLKNYSFLKLFVAVTSKNFKMTLNMTEDFHCTKLYISNIFEFFVLVIDGLITSWYLYHQTLNS